MKILRASLSRWWYGAAIAVALLVLPITAWFAFPRAEPIAAPQASSATTAATAADDEPEPDRDLTASRPSQRKPRTSSAPSAAEIAGVVVDGAGEAIADAYVVCSHDPELHATTTAEGTFTLAATADGCSATASHPDYGASPPVTLAAGGKNRLEMPSPGRITGSVVDDKGKPFASFTIGIESFVADGEEAPQPFFRQKKFDDPTGQFELDKLSPGKYVLSASVVGRPPAKSKSITVSSGQRSRGVQIVVGLGTTLSGTVTDRETGDPIEGVRVRLDAAVIGGSRTSATTDMSGRYTLEGVPGAAFSARFSHRDYKERIVSLDGSGGALTQDIDLGKRGDGADMEMSGIGASLVAGAKFVEIGSLVPGGPAESAGVEVGDRIERIERKSAEGLPVNDAVQQLRGPEGTRVTVTLGRGTKRLDVTITRAVIVR